MITLLLLTLAIPVLTAALLMLFGASAVGRSARWIALVGACAALVSSLVLVRQYRDFSADREEFAAHAIPSPAGIAPVQPRVSATHEWFSTRPDTGRLSRPNDREDCDD